ncbi:MAG TPA: sulfite exporter TauE/SafE family protein, partial [Bacillota bacterium]|nr:sulfite exporter TauE/SafE family protein [Bacillota bacterium]
LVGALGSVLSFSSAAKGTVTIFSGVLMVVFGLNMLNLFPWLRRFQPRLPKFLGKALEAKRGKLGPFGVGLLNGLMPCGPLQTMQMYALGTGSFFGGAAAMFLFSLGTVPLMFGLGAISTILSRKFTGRMLKFSAILVIVLGLVMVNRGLSLSGKTFAISDGGSQAAVAQLQGTIQTVTTGFDQGRYQPFVVQKGVPVRWIIQARPEDLNGCNNPIAIPEYGIEKRLVPGENIIEFTPTKEGNITYTCWMGMISSNIKVVKDLEQVSPDDLTAPPSTGGSGGCCAF